MLKLDSVTANRWTAKLHSQIRLGFELFFFHSLLFLFDTCTTYTFHSNFEYDLMLCKNCQTIKGLSQLFTICELNTEHTRFQCASRQSPIFILCCPFFFFQMQTIYKWLLHLHSFYTKIPSQYKFISFLIKFEFFCTNQTQKFRQFLVVFFVYLCVCHSNLTLIA